MVQSGLPPPCGEGTGVGGAGYGEARDVLVVEDTVPMHELPPPREG